MVLLLFSLPHFYLFTASETFFGGREDKQGEGGTISRLNTEHMGPKGLGTSDHHRDTVYSVGDG
jgi:hypothetical protein